LGLSNIVTQGGPTPVSRPTAVELMETRAAYWVEQVEAGRLSFTAAARAFTDEVVGEVLAVPLRRVVRAYLRRAYCQARWSRAFLDPLVDPVEVDRVGARLREEDARVRAALAALWAERDDLRSRPEAARQRERAKERHWVNEAKINARAGRLAFVRRRAGRRRSPMVWSVRRRNVPRCRSRARRLAARATPTRGSPDGPEDDHGVTPGSRVAPVPGGAAR
jgi:hypothetical protein